MKIVFAMAAFAAATVAQPASAAAMVEFVESGVNVVATMSRTLDTTGIVKKNRHSSSYANAATCSSAPGDDIFAYSGFNGIPAFGPGGADRGEGFGDPLSINGKLVGLATGYVSGDNIFAVLTFANATFASIGLTPGTYVETSANDSITLTVRTAVPEPATWELMLIGLRAVGLTLRGRAKG